MHSPDHCKRASSHTSINEIEAALHHCLLCQGCDEPAILGRIKPLSLNLHDDSNTNQTGAEPSHDEIFEFREKQT